MRMDHRVVDLVAATKRLCGSMRRKSRRDEVRADLYVSGPNDALAECCIDLKLLYMNLMRLQKTQEVERQLYDMTFAGESRHAKLDMSVELLPRHEAEKLEALAGLGRSAPNQNPYLARPQRRAVDSAGSRGKPKSGSS